MIHGNLPNNNPKNENETILCDILPFCNIENLLNSLFCNIEEHSNEVPAYIFIIK